MPNKTKKSTYKPRKKTTRKVSKKRVKLFNVKLPTFKRKIKRKKYKRNKKAIFRKRDRALIVIVLFLLIGGWYFDDETIDPKTWVEHDNTPSVFSTSQVSNQDFIAEIGQYAQDNYEDSGILPSVVIAQAILESDFGASDLAATYNNLYGYKAHGNQLAVDMPTLEYVEGVWIEVSEPFKVYQSWRDSVRDHGKLMYEGTEWDSNLYQGVVNAGHYTEATKALQEAGYATDPNYSVKLNNLIEKYGLNSYDYWE